VRYLNKKKQRTVVRKDRQTATKRRYDDSVPVYLNVIQPSDKPRPLGAVALPRLVFYIPLWLVCGGKDATRKTKTLLGGQY